MTTATTTTNYAHLEEMKQERATIAESQDTLQKIARMAKEKEKEEDLKEDAIYAEETITNRSVKKA